MASALHRRTRQQTNVAIFTPTGIRDLLISGWVVGVPLLVVAASMWRRCNDHVIMTLCYAIPSVAFLTFRPPQGLGVDTGHVVATFPAFYASAWLCAPSPARRQCLPRC